MTAFQGSAENIVKTSALIAAAMETSQGPVAYVMKVTTETAVKACV